VAFHASLWFFSPKATYIFSIKRAGAKKGPQLSLATEKSLAPAKI
jgi:hypothetical protein